MKYNIPDRRLDPPEPPEPYTQCWYCNEDIYLDRDNYIETIDSYPVCGRDECIEAIGIEIGADEEYKDLNDDYTFIDFVRDEYSELEYIPTEEDYQLMKGEEKAKEEVIK